MDLTAGNGAGSGPPSPTQKGQELVPPPPPPPGLPIDDNIIYLFIIAVMFGVFIIYRSSIKAKTTV